MKKIFRFFVIFMLMGILLALAGFLALALYYRDNFPVNTWINGVYCTGKSVRQVNEELVNAQEASMITIVDADGIYWELDMQEAGIMPDYTAQLNSYLRQYATFIWIENLGNTVSKEMAPEYYVAEEEKLRAAYEQLPFVAAEKQKGEGVSVLYSEEGYYLQDDNLGHLDVEKAYSWMKECLGKGQTMISLQEGECYKDIPDNAEDRIQRGVWEQICEYVDRCRKIVYDMGAEKIVFTPDISCRFLKREEGSEFPLLDEQGEIMVDEARVEAWVEQLAETYNTYGKEREFQTTRGDLITVDYVTYGTELDGKAEKEYLMQALQTEFTGEQIHIPAYKREGFARGLDDIGDTYIEIDMTEQKMYYYADGELVLETDVVTGDTGKRRGTPTGVYYVYNMERNRTLRGTGYTSFVKYWMPINGGVGIHDASWRRSFGGEIYKTDGSHGCINTPTDVMGELYEMAEIGTPAIVFY